MMNNLQEFIDYVWLFYGEHSETIYPIKGLTKDDILDAFKVYCRRIQDAEKDINPYYTWGGGDSLDRERVRDIILDNPKFTWSH